MEQMEMHHTTLLALGWLGVAAMLASAPSSSAAQGHAHDHGAQAASGQQRMHGAEDPPGNPNTRGLRDGQFARTSEFYIESIFLADGVRVYVHDREQRPVSADAVFGTITLSQFDGRSKEIDFEMVKPTENEGVSHLYAAVDLAGVIAGQMKAEIHLRGLPSEDENEVLFRQAVPPMVIAGYVCPMHSAVASTTAGDCDRCGMAMEPAQVLYVCPMHPEITAAEKTSCNLCGMELKLSKRPTEAPGQRRGGD